MFTLCPRLRVRHHIHLVSPHGCPPSCPPCVSVLVPTITSTLFPRRGARHHVELVFHLGANHHLHLSLFSRLGARHHVHLVTFVDARYYVHIVSSALLPAIMSNLFAIAFLDQRHCVHLVSPALVPPSFPPCVPVLFVPVLVHAALYTSCSWLNARHLVLLVFLVLVPVIGLGSKRRLI